MRKLCIIVYGIVKLVFCVVFIVVGYLVVRIPGVSWLVNRSLYGKDGIYGDKK